MLLGTQKVRETKTWELYFFDKIIKWRNETVDSNLFNRISLSEVFLNWFLLNLFEGLGKVKMNVGK